MRIALLINDKEFREVLSAQLRATFAEVVEFPTGAKALGMFEASRYDSIVIHWKVYPGLNAGDPELQELAAIIPTVSMNRNVLFWAAARRVLDVIRADHSANKLTPVMVLLSGLDEPNGEDRDRLARESIDRDLAGSQPVIVVTDATREGIVRAITDYFSDGKRR